MKTKHRDFPSPTTCPARLAAMFLFMLAVCNLAAACTGNDSAATPESSPATNDTPKEAGQSQTLRVSRADTTILNAPAYTGESIELSKLDGTMLDYVLNSTSPVLRTSDNTWFTCEDGIWFTSESPDGPWRVATAIPWSIVLIPENHPLAFLKYAHLLGYDGQDVWIELAPEYFAANEKTEEASLTPDTMPASATPQLTNAIHKTGDTSTINYTVTNNYDFSDYDSLSVRLRPRADFFWNVGWGLGLTWRSDIWWPFYGVWWSSFPLHHHHHRHYRPLPPWYRHSRPPMIFSRPAYTRQWVDAHRPPPMYRPVVVITRPRGGPPRYVRPAPVRPAKPIVIKPVVPPVGIGRPIVTPRPPVRRPPNQRPGVIRTPGKPTHPIVPRPGPVQRPDVRPRPAPPPVGRPGWRDPSRRPGETPIARPVQPQQPTPPKPGVPIARPTPTPRPVKSPPPQVHPAPPRPTPTPRPVQPPPSQVRPAPPRPVQPSPPSPPPRAAPSPSPSPRSEPPSPPSAAPRREEERSRPGESSGGPPRRR
ncbi:MAG: hypothetical protein LBD01_06475 [Puniceicoccales bacterium]|nr:hypothetical protein [Puniceicoccales bacterium]